VDTALAFIATIWAQFLRQDVTCPTGSVRAQR
jgi:hypothetical protein